MSHEKFKSCITACAECAAECKHCSDACLKEDNVKMLVRCIGLDEDCAALCLLSIELMASGSEFAGKVCALCAEVCETCAAECEKHEHDHCKRCAEMCRKCATECRKMQAA